MKNIFLSFMIAFSISAPALAQDKNPQMTIEQEIALAWNKVAQYRSSANDVNLGGYRFTEQVSRLKSLYALKGQELTDDDLINMSADPETKRKVLEEQRLLSTREGVQSRISMWNAALKKYPVGSMPYNRIKLEIHGLEMRLINF